MIDDDDLTPEQKLKLKAWIEDGKLWISVDAAIRLIEERLNTTAGHAQKLLADARASGEVRFANDDGIVCDPRFDCAFRKDDLIGWLRRNHPRANVPEKSSGGAMLKRAQLALAALYPEGVPDPAVVRNKMLCLHVGEWLKKNSLDAPGNDTILRAAKRK
ncbi:MAG: hypothetical protein U1E81_16175 [Xanthobacteraceae bacterium]